MTTTLPQTRAARRINPAHQARRIETRRIDNILPHVKPDMPLFNPYHLNRNLSMYNEAGDKQPKLTGNYEVLLPDRNERIYFADTLREVVVLLSGAFGGSAQDEAEFEFLLRKAIERNELKADSYGMRFHRTKGGAPWIAKVRGPQTRPAPAFKVDDQVYTDTSAEELAARRPSAKPLKVGNIYLVNHPNPGKQYLYYVGGTGGAYLRQERLTHAFPKN